MKTSFITLAVLIVLVSSLHANERFSKQWEALTRASPGVYVVKLQDSNSVRFVYFAAGDRVRPISTLTSAEIAFTRIDDAVKFAQARPPRAVLMEADTDEIIDDIGILVPLSSDERTALGVVQWSKNDG